MLEQLINMSIRHRWMMMIVTLALMALGVYNATKLPIDAVPDITNVQVQINTAAPGYSPLEVEQRVTFPLETALMGLPSMDYTRSISRYGLSQVTVIFDEGTDIYFARQLINERLSAISGEIPQELKPEMGPISTGLGEIFFYVVDADPNVLNEDGKPYSPMDLLTMQEWVVLPQLRTLKGVVEINTMGGYEKEFHIMPDMNKLRNYNLTMDDLTQTIERNNSNVGAGYIEKNGEQYLVRVPGQIKDIEHIKNLSVKKRDDVDLLISDVAEVQLGAPLRTGAATRNGQEVVLGTAMMLMGENSRNVAARVGERIKEIQQSLPKGITLRPVYDRTSLVDRTIQTVQKNLIEGALLVIVILFLFLGNMRAALITAMVIPASMLMTITGMVKNEVSGNLMSLGALDFGLIVDGAVIIVENCIRHFSMKQKQLGRILTSDERHKVAAKATAEVIKPSLFGVMIITLVYLPIFTLDGVEGKMFHPMAFTVVVALISALFLCLTFVPAAVAIFVKGSVEEKEGRVYHALHSGYTRILGRAVLFPRHVMLAGLLVTILSCLPLMRMGTVFVPHLDEGDIAVQALRAPGTSLSESVKMQKLIEKRTLEFAEVREVIGRTGTAEVATDVMPPNITDTYILLKDRKDWPNPDKLKPDLIAEIEMALKEIPGNNYEFSQPIQLRFNELISGVRSDVAVKIFGDDLDQLLKSAGSVEAVMSDIQGAADVKIEQVTGLPILSIKPNIAKLRQYGLSVKAVQDMIQLSIGGLEVGQIFEGDRRFNIVLRLNEDNRSDIDKIKYLPITLPSTTDQIEERGFTFHPTYVPLQEVADVEIVYGPNQISRENAKRRIVISANIRGRDLAGFVEDLKQNIQAKVQFPSGYWIEYGGTFQQLLSAKQRLQVVVPLALIMILGLLYMAFGSMREALIIFSGVPFALTGGIMALWLRDIPLSVSAGVGFIALSGISVLNGVVMISFIKTLIQQGYEPEKAILEGASTRLRPILMTALVASLGFVPMALNTGAGAEVQRPLATTVIGGIISSTILTLLILPVLYQRFYKRTRGK